MSTRNFTSVVLEGKQVVCQYGQHDGYPTVHGAMVLEFIKKCDLEHFKKALANTKLSVIEYDNAKIYTGSNKDISDIDRHVFETMMELNANRKDDEYVYTYGAVKHMVEQGSLSDKEADDYVVSVSRIGRDILDYIYNRPLDKEPLEIFACKEEYDEISSFVLSNGDVPGCDAQGYYVINLDKNVIEMTYNDYSLTVPFDNIPNDIDREMYVWDKCIRLLEENEDINLMNYVVEGEDEKGAGGLWDLAAEYAVEVGLKLRDTDSFVDVSKDDVVYAEEFGQEYIYNILRAKQQELMPKLDKLEEFLDSKEISVYKASDGWELEWYSPAGEDFCFYLRFDGTIKDFIKEFREYARAFDVDEHVSMWTEARNNVSGVPSSRELVEDAEAIEAFLNEVADELGNMNFDKKPTLSDQMQKAQNLKSSECENTIKNKNEIEIS